MTPNQFAGVMQFLSGDPARLADIGGSGDIGYLNQYEAGNIGDQAAQSARQLIAKQLGLPMLSAFGLPDQYDASYYTTPSDIQSAARREQAFQGLRNDWMAAHPGVALPPWQPLYIDQAAALDAPSLMSALYNENAMSIL